MAAAVDPETTYERDGQTLCAEHENELLAESLPVQYGTPAVPVDLQLLRELAPNANDLALGGCLGPVEGAEKFADVLYCVECRRVKARLEAEASRRSSGRSGDREEARSHSELDPDEADAEVNPSPSGFSLPLTWILLAIVVGIVLIIC